jgi:Transcriptional regulator/sugar kinase
MAVRRGINHTQGKKKNISYIKEIIFEHSPISRVEIADMMSLTPATITNNVSLLLETGIIREIHADDSPEDSAVGRRPIMLEFVADAKYVIGLEVSPRGILLSICDLNGHAVYENKLEGNYRDYERTLQYMKDIIEESLEKSRVPHNKVLGVGICCPGFIDRETGFIKYGIWPEWENKNLLKDFQEITEFEVCVDNNASVRAIHEGLFNRNRPATFAYLFVSKGIACPLMIQNSVLSRRVTGAGEIGHMIMDIHGPRCERCGNFGCLETFAGEDAIRKNCAEAMKTNAKTLLAKSVKDPEKPTIEEIIAAASKKDKMVNEILDKAIQYLAVGICNIIKFVSPEMVVVDAYIMILPELKEKFLKYVSEYLSQNKWYKVEFVFKDFDEYGGAKGAVALALKNFLLSDRN